MNKKILIIIFVILSLLGCTQRSYFLEESGSITDTTLDTNSNAEFSWLGKSHVFRVDQNFYSGKGIDFNAVKIFGVEHTNEGTPKLTFNLRGVNESKINFQERTNVGFPTIIFDGTPQGTGIIHRVLYVADVNQISDGIIFLSDRNFFSGEDTSNGLLRYLSVPDILEITTDGVTSPPIRLTSGTGIYLRSSLIPDINNLYYNGSDTNRWLEVHSQKYCLRGTCINLWTDINGSGGGTPGGSDKEIQFNNAGTFGGDQYLTYDLLTAFLKIQGQFEVTNLSTNDSQFKVFTGGDVSIGNSTNTGKFEIDYETEINKSTDLNSYTVVLQNKSETTGKKAGIAFRIDSTQNSSSRPMAAIWGTRNAFGGGNLEFSLSESGTTDLNTIMILQPDKNIFVDGRIDTNSLTVDLNSNFGGDVIVQTGFRMCLTNSCTDWVKFTASDFNFSGVNLNIDQNFFLNRFGFKRGITLDSAGKLIIG